jgi:hypothetical protein
MTAWVRKLKSDEFFRFRVVQYWEPLEPLSCRDFQDLSLEQQPSSFAYLPTPLQDLTFFSTQSLDSSSSSSSCQVGVQGFFYLYQKPTVSQPFIVAWTYHEPDPHPYVDLFLDHDEKDAKEKKEIHYVGCIFPLLHPQKNGGFRISPCDMSLPHPNSTLTEPLVALLPFISSLLALYVSNDLCPLIQDYLYQLRYQIIFINLNDREFCRTVGFRFGSFGPLQKDYTHVYV